MKEAIPPNNMLADSISVTGPEWTNLEGQSGRRKEAGMQADGGGGTGKWPSQGVVFQSGQ